MYINVDIYACILYVHMYLKKIFTKKKLVCMYVCIANFNKNKLQNSNNNKYTTKTKKS